MQQDNKNNDVKIKQINPQKKLSDLEKTAIMQFKIEQQEELSKTSQFKLLNKRKKNDIELPKKKVSLTDTIKLKISDLREAVDKKNMDLPKLKQRKSLYDTVIIKLDDIINKNSSLKNIRSKKVLKIEEPVYKKKFHLFKPKDITKAKEIHINVDSEEFGRQLYNLNKIALTTLSKDRPKIVRRYSTLAKLSNMERIHISKQDYAKYERKLNRFAIEKLYYKLAPKESKKYKLYKYSVMVSGMVFVITSAIILNWFIQGLSINRLSHSLTEDTPIVETIEGDLVNIEPDPEEVPEPEKQEEYSNKNTLYWKYLNTPLSSVDFSSLLKENKDTVGWIIVNNTNVNYPVVQANDNDYYLQHDFNKKRNSAGWVFADFRDDFSNFNQNMVIYAHGRKDKVMFGSLTNTLQKKWYTNLDNQIIQLSTIKYNTMWQIFAIYKVEAESYYITTDFSSDESFENFIQTMKDRSIYDFGVDVNKDDKLLTLSTCYNDNGIRLVVQAKLVKIQER
mgnify:CR=1 FL=1